MFLRSERLGHASGRIRVRTALAVACLALSAVSSRAVDSPREIRERATIRLAAGDYQSAIPDLEALIEMLDESERSQVQASLETVYYNLGLSYFFTGQFSETRRVFELYDKRYPRGARRSSVALYRADSLRLDGKAEDAIREYESILRQFTYDANLLTDIYCALARCHVSRDDWHAAIPQAEKAFRVAPDAVRRGWAAALLATAYFKDLAVEKIFPITSALLREESFASRSVAFNLAALEAGDILFGEEQYREALWVYRMVYPYDTVLSGCEEYLEQLRNLAEWARSATAGDPRVFFRVQEGLGEQEAELEAIRETANYDIELFFRLGRSYMQLLRLREARRVFLHLHDVAEAQLAEEALYYAFHCSLGIEPWEEALEIGHTYMEAYPAGEYYDTLTLTMGQMYAQRHDWTNVIDHFTGVLEVRPNHEAGAECLFLLGYASFMEEKFEAAIAALQQILERFPATPLREEVLYWTGMSLMYDRRYEEASTQFDLLLQGFPDGDYYADGFFRRAVCDYGRNELEPADERLRAFLDLFPDSKLVGEAYMMRGDIAGALGHLNEAVEAYQSGMTDTNLHAEAFNHCSFQCGNILMDEERYGEVRAHFDAYIAAAREGSNIPMAIYWIGKALWNAGRQAEAVKYYRQAVETYGRDPGAIGIDMILDEWIGDMQRSTDEIAREGWRDLHASYARALAQREVSLALRLARVLLYEPELTDSERERRAKQFLNPAALPAASPGVLQYILDLAAREGDEALERQAAERMLVAYPETDYALDAHMLLADFALRDAAKETAGGTRQRLRDEARAHFEFVRDHHATSGEAGVCWIKLGRMHAEDGDYEAADACYQAVLGVKEWRSLWPEALYGRGEALFTKGDFDKAAAYYERIYVLYGHFVEWTAKAYWRRAECLNRSRRPDLAREVLEEMISIKDLDQCPETHKARAYLLRRNAS